MLEVIALDPGVTTGVAHWLNGRLHTTAQLDQDMTGDWIHLAATDRQPGELVVVCESYVVTAETLRKSRQTASLEIIGAVKWLGHYHGFPVVMQQASSAKKFATDDRLRAAGWRQPSSMDHANDALRHLLTYLVKARIMEVPRGEG